MKLQLLHVNRQSRVRVLLSATAPVSGTSQAGTSQGVWMPIAPTCSSCKQMHKEGASQGASEEYVQLSRMEADQHSGPLMAVATSEVSLL
jgi:hypothetical protein